MKYIVCLLLFFSCLHGFEVRAQGDSQPILPSFEYTPLGSPQDQVVMDSLMRWEEQVYLHTDRERALPGEALFFKAYVYNSPTQRRFSPSGVLRLELLNEEGALVTTQYHPLSRGAGEGVLRLPEKLEEGTYELVAHTRWMQNYGEDQFFRKFIQVGEDVEESPLTQRTIEQDISFHPEGGRLLAGIQNRLIVRAPGDMSASLQGEILDEEGNSLVPVQPYAEGYGMVIFTPEAGMDYRFRTSDGAELSLPEIGVRGYSLKVNNLGAEKISMEVQPTPGMGGDPVILKGERDGQTYFIHMMEFDDRGIASLEIPKAGLPTGFVDFTLTGLDEVEWARRPVWIGNDGSLNVESKALKSDWSEGGEVAFRIRVTDSEGNPVQTDLSLAVTNSSTISVKGIDSYLKPIVPVAEVSDERRLRFIEDLKVQSSDKRTGDRKIPNEIRFPVERSLELHGTAYDLNNNLLANTEIQMFATSDTDLVIREMKTDASGVLHISDLDVIGETQLIFRTKGEEMAQRLVKIRPIKKESQPDPETKEEEVAKSRIYKKAQKKKPLVETTPPVPFDTTGVIVLDEATVEKRRDQQKVVPSLYNLQPNKNDVVYQDPERPMPIQILAQNIPGIQTRVTPEGLPVITHMRRGGGGIVWVVDGQIIRTSTGQVIVNGLAMGGDDPFLSPLTFLAPGDILRMEFYIDTADTSMFGLLGPNSGVMVVYTRSGNYLDYVNRKDGGLLFKGYEPKTDFDTWMAERQSNRKLRKTEPQTLYWNPSVQTDKNGEAVIRFKSPGDFEGINLSVETLTPEGKVVAHKERF